MYPELSVLEIVEQRHVRVVFTAPHRVACWLSSGVFSSYLCHWYLEPQKDTLLCNPQVLPETISLKIAAFCTAKDSSCWLSVCNGSPPWAPAWLRGSWKYTNEETTNMQEWCRTLQCLMPRDFSTLWYSVNIVKQLCMKRKTHKLITHTNSSTCS